MIYMYLKILVLLYADDTVILAESSDDLQIGLDMYSSYCRQWKLKINYDTTKIMVFARGRTANFIFTINGIQLEVISDFKYLGILFLSKWLILCSKKVYCQIRLPEQCLVFERKPETFSCQLTYKLNYFRRQSNQYYYLRIEITILRLYRVMKNISEV